MGHKNIEILNNLFPFCLEFQKPGFIMEAQIQSLQICFIANKNIITNFIFFFGWNHLNTIYIF